MSKSRPRWIEILLRQEFSHNERFVLCAAAFLAYILTRLFSMEIPARLVIGITQLPLMLIAWFFGIPAGLAASVLLYLLNTVIDHFPGPYSFQMLVGLDWIEMVYLLIAVAIFGIMGSLARQLRVELEERRQSEEKIRRYAARIDTLRIIQQDILNLQSPEEMARLLLSRLHQLHMFEQAAVFLFEEDDTQLRMVAAGQVEKGDALYPAHHSPLQGSALEQMKRGEIFMVEDVRLQAEKCPLEESYIVNGILSYACIPMLSQGKLLGFLCFSYGKPHHFSAEECDIFDEIADSLAVSLQQAILFQAEVAARRQAENLRRAGVSISSNLALDKVLNALLFYLEEVVPYNAAAVFLKMEDAYVLVAGRGFKDMQGTIGLRAGLDNYFFQKISETRTPIILEDAQKDEHFKVWAPAHDVRGWMGVPLVWQKHVIGVLNLDSYQTGTYNEKNLSLAQDFAWQAAVAIQNARLLEEANRRAEEAETLRQTGSALTALLPPEEMFEKVLEQLMRVVPCDSSSILMVEGDELVLVNGRGFPDIRKILGQRVKLDASTPASIVIAENRPIILANAPETYEVFRVEPHIYTVSLLCVPLTMRGRALGVLALDSKQEDHFTADHARLAMAFASQVAIALDSSHLLEETRRQAREAETLRQAGAAITALLPREEMIDRVVEQLMQVVPCDRARVLLVEGDEMVAVGGRGYSDPSDEIGARIKITPNIPSYVVIQEKNPLILTNHPEKFKNRRVVSFLSVPLLVRERVIGLFTLESLEANHFNDRHAGLVMTFAAQVAVAVENSLLFEGLRELTIIDPLTGLYTRRHFFDVAQSALAHALRYQHPMSLIMMDVDRFKSFNDTYGHLLGDRILQHFGKCLQKGLRTSDIAARYGGDEFVVLLPETDIEEAQMAAQRLQEAIRQPLEDAIGIFTLNTSMGLASLKKDETRRLEDLLDKADKAMYIAKAAGGDRIVS